MKYHISQALGRNGRNGLSRSCGTVIIKSIGESLHHGTSANQASKAYQKELYLDMAI